MRVEHLFFDLDRTLWDFDSNSHDALSQIFDELNLGDRIKNKKAFISDYKRINEEMWAAYRQGSLQKEELRMGRFLRALKKHDVDDLDLAESYAESYLELCPKLTKLFPNTLDTLSVLKQMGKQLHIITNGFSEVQYLKLERSGLADFFDVVICSDTVGINKPDKRIFREALIQASAKPIESMMIGDHLETDVLGAHAAGLTGVLFDPKKEYKNLRGITKIQTLPELSSLIF